MRLPRALNAAEDFIAAIFDPTQALERHPDAVVDAHMCHFPPDASWASTRIFSSRARPRGHGTDSRINSTAPEARCRRARAQAARSGTDRLTTLRKGEERRSHRRRLCVTA